MGTRRRALVANQHALAPVRARTSPGIQSASRLDARPSLLERAQPRALRPHEDIPRRVQPGSDASLRGRPHVVILEVWPEPRAIDRLLADGAIVVAARDPAVLQVWMSDLGSSGSQVDHVLR